MTGKLSKIKLNDYQPLREVIFNTLREAIIMGELKPGERLMEVHLAEKMGVSRTPVRESIRKLELEGLVTMVPRKGTFVSTLSPKDIMDVLEIRASLDALATSLAAKRIKDTELRELDSVHAQFVSNIEKGNLQGVIKKDVEFHEIIYRSSRNDRLMQISSSLREQVQRYRVVYLKGYSNTSEILDEHTRIIKAISAGDAKLAASIAEEHIKNQEKAIISTIKKSNIQ